MSAILAAILSNILIFGFQDNHQIVIYFSNAKICRCVMSTLIFMQLKGKFSEITLSQPFCPPCWTNFGGHLVRHLDIPREGPGVKSRMCTSVSPA